MSFIERKIDVRIALNGDTFDGNNDTLVLSGLRCDATIQSTVGGSTPFQSQMQIRINGMRGADMAKLSTLGYSDGTMYKKNRIDVFAGDDVVGMTQVFSGAIFAGSVDYNSMPDVGVDLVASVIMNEQMVPVAASSYKGSLDVASMLQAIATTAGWSFQNAGVHARLHDHAVGGSATDQISDICQAAGIFFEVSNKKLSIWPHGGKKDDTLITVSPSTGLVGYPMYSMNGVTIVTTFNPDIQLGRMVKVETSVPNLSPDTQKRFVGGDVAPGSNGAYSVWDVVHQIASQTVNGPWFTRTRMGVDNFYGR
jgi:hypothetical protein